MSKLASSEFETRDEIAADWVLKLRAPDLSEATTTAWIEWCEADPLNRIAFEKMAALWQAAGDLDHGGFAETGAGPANDNPPLWRRGWAIGLAAAASLLLVLAGTLWLSGSLPGGADRTQTARLQTPVGQIRGATLEDGSRIELGGRSTVAVRYSNAQRTIIAEDGEAFFTVARNPDRPFVVEAGPVTVTAVGTAFSVQRDGNSVAVLVTEGIVEIRASATILRASAGHRVRFYRGELAQSVEPVQADAVAPWREGRLEFRDEPLRLVIARINRYSERQLEISDPSIADLRLTTTVYGDRVDAWLQGLSEVLPVRVSRSGNRATISPAT